MMINAIRSTEKGIDVKPIEFSELLEKLEPGNPDSYDKVFNEPKTEGEN